MTEYAILCFEERHRDLPAVSNWDWELRSPDPMVVPWRCPSCNQVLAQTLIDPRVWDLVQTVMVHFRPVREPSAAEDGIPMYRPTRRHIRGKTERHGAAQYDAVHSNSHRVLAREDVILEREFDSVCDNCGHRLRFEVPKAITDPLYS
jgi:hypothetical protein